MRRDRTIRLLQVLALGGLLAGCDEAAPSAAAPIVRDTTAVAVLFDVGGRGDGGFNDGAAAGAERARALGGIHLEYAGIGDGATRTETLRTLARSGIDLVVAIGFLASREVTIVAREFPDVHFAVIDYALPTDAEGRAMEPPPNLAGITFREEEGSYLVGAIAALSSRSGVVGFVGGMDSPLIRKFEAGFTAGVHRVCETCTVNSRYLGRTPEAFTDSAGGHRTALELMRRGADVVFHAAGASGTGTIAAVRERGRLAIGVDVDQAALAPGHVLTSMVKRIDVAVFDAIRRERQGKFRPGMTSLGLAEGGVAYVDDARNGALLSPRARAHAETLRAAVVAGLLSAAGGR